MATVVGYYTRELRVGRNLYDTQVIHAGIYYPPGSLKTKLCIEGARWLYDVLPQVGVKHKKIGTYKHSDILRTACHALQAFKAQFQRLQANGLSPRHRPNLNAFIQSIPMLRPLGCQRAGYPNQRPP